VYSEHESYTAVMDTPLRVTNDTVRYSILLCNLKIQCGDQHCSTNERIIEAIISAVQCSAV
jgi:hypothetical protein